MRGQSRTTECSPRDRATSEEEIVRVVKRAQANEQDAFTELWKRFNRPLMAFLSRRWEGALSTEDVEDLCQVSFAKAFKAIGTFRFDCLFSSWLFKIATNECIRWMARRRKMMALLSSPAVQDECNKTVASHELRTMCTVRAEKVSAQMDAQWQRVIQRVFQNGETAPEIAADEGIKPDRVRYIVRVFLEKAVCGIVEKSRVEDD
jgi:RNA polymerase sigma factor (sigma-70 family)